MISKNQKAFNLVYYWGMSGMLQAIFSPDISQGFPHFHFIRFWIGHNGMILSILYCVSVYKMQPTVKGITNAFIACNILMFLVIPINYFLDSNYLWICEKPETKSLLDFLGPWPYYIFSVEILAIVHFYCAYVPFLLLKKRKNEYN